MSWITWSSALLALIGVIWTAGWTLDERYARASDMQQQIGDVKGLYLESERRSLQRQKFELEVAKERRPLTTLERQRLKEVEDELRSVDERLKAVQRSK